MEKKEKIRKNDLKRLRRDIPVEVAESCHNILDLDNAAESFIASAIWFCRQQLPQEDPDALLIVIREKLNRKNLKVIHRR